MNFLAQLRSGGSNVGAAHSRHGTARSGAYSHRSAKESVGRRVHAADGHSVSRNHDGGSASSRIGVGTVLVMLQETPDGPQPPPLRVQNKDGKIVPRDHFFLAVLAPDNDQALAFLAVQPAGTFVLVKEAATGDIAVYVKFQAAVRSFTVLKNKEIKRAKPNEDLVEWGRAYRALNTPHAEALATQSTLMTPVHRLYLPPDKYAYLERCWLHFLPQVQAIAFELCTQPYYMDEEIAMEDWSALILASRVPCVAFVSVDSCGFHLFNTTAIAAAAAAESSNSASASALSISAAASVPVRIVEFDIAQCLISIADGAFRPSSFVTPVHFGTAKMYDAELGFAAIRENFLAPDRVALKEATTTTSATAGASGVASSAWQDLGPLTASGDAELQHLLAVRALVAAVVPHEPLPEGLVDALARLHRLWAAQTPAQSRGRWRTPAKLKCVKQVLPLYLELLLATAATDVYVQRELGAGKPDLLPRLAAALAFDVRCMARRAGDATVARLVHHVLQAMALRASVPRALVALVSDLCVESARFRELFMRNQGASLLWKAIHTASVLDAVSLPLLLQTQQLQQAAQRGGAPLMGDLPKRRSSLFGGRRKSQNARSGGSRKSLAFNASIVLPVTFETTVQVFFRLNPLLVQLELAAQLKDAHFGGPATMSTAMTATTTAAMTAAANRTVSPSGSMRKASWGGMLTRTTATNPTTTALGEMVVFIERLAFFLMADPSSPTWEKDVLQLLRMEDLYVHLHNEIVGCVAQCGDGDDDDDDDEDDAGDESVRDARARLETVVECVAALYRLETKRRRHATTLIGEKKYWFLFHLLRQPVRAFHERTREQLRAAHAAGSEDADPSSLSAQDESADDAAGLAVLAWILPKLPRQLVTEFVLVSLDDVLQATRILHECVQRRAGNASGQVRPARLARLLVRVLTAMLRRACDFDLQLLLVRVLASSGSSVPAVLQVLVKEATKHGPARFGVERELLAFGEAFVALATALPQLEKWHATRDTLYAQLENRDDVEGNEQRKTMLMATVLSPENGVADSDEILWDTIQDMLVPSHSVLEASHEQRARLSVVELFYSKIVFMQSDALPAFVRHRENLRAFKMYLRVRARVFLSPILESPRLAKAQLREFVELHWNFLYDLRSQFKSVYDDDDDDEEADGHRDGDGDVAALRDACRSLALLHLRCLLALASRRVLLPVLDEAFLDFRTARELLRILQQGTMVRHHHHHHHHHEAPRSTPSGLGPGLSLTLPGRVEAPASPVSSHAPTATTVSFQASELLLSSPVLHATAVLTILSCAVSEAHSLNEHIVPRYFIPSNIEGSSLNLLPDEDLLLSLQRHLKAADSPALRGALQACLQEAELDQQFGPPGRAHAVRVLLKLLTPDSYDTRLYAHGTHATAVSTRIAAHRESEASDSEDEADHHEEKRDQPAAALPQDEEERLMARAQPREYVARGAFATVYRAMPCVAAPLGSGGDVAIKVCAHQRSSGELCVAAEVFNEVVVLERLRGNLAATQLLDFGNNTTESQSFELVLEHCPATLAQWRQSLDAGAASGGASGDGDGVQAVGVPFRSLLSLSLGAFIDVVRAVAQIHADHVCHFDVKADNVLLRVESTTMTAQLLREHGAPDQEADEASASVPRVCLADFGESVVLPPAQSEGLLLSRTRGTEAIKSPEMLRVKGGEAASGPRVGPASDVWSLGCLLFELLTEEVMFASDDWAQLYAHLVAAESTASRTSSMVAPVVREDHAEKLLRVLAPKTDAEKALATIFLQFLESILTRNAAARPPLATVLAEAEAQRRMILALPAQPADEAFVAACLASGGSGAGSGGSSATTTTSPEPSAPMSVSHLRLPPSATGPTDCTGPLAARLFFNLYLARDARVLRVAASASARATPAATSAATSETADATPRGRASDDGRSTLLGDALLRQELSALQVAIESRFSHFIYFCYDDVKRQVARDGGGGGAELDAAPADVAASLSPASSRPDDSGAFLEIVEGVGRTVFYFSRARVLACLQADGASATVGGGGGGNNYGARTTSAGNSLSSARAPADAAMAAAMAAPSLVRLLLQHSRGILGTLQRHVRHQSSRVLLVPADYDALDDAARPQPHASPLAELTTATLLFFLTTGLALAPLEALGAFARECHALTPLPSERVLAPLLRLHEERAATARAAAAAERSLHARACVRCRCGDKVLSAPLAAAATAATFSPPPVDADADAEVVWDPRETRLVVGGGDACGRGPWRVVDTLAVDRLDSLLRTVLRRQLGPAAVATAPRGGRKSLGQLAAAHSHGHGVGDAGALREHVPFVLHGLSEAARVAEGDAAAGAPWTLYECALCATRVCAVSSSADKMALPL